MIFHCPEQNCSVIFAYLTVRNILQSIGDAQLIERYDRYPCRRRSYAQLRNSNRNYTRNTIAFTVPSS